jgi:hypothetical protein
MTTTPATLGDAAATPASPDPCLQLADLAHRRGDEAFELLVARPELVSRIAPGDYAVGTAVIGAAALRADATSAPVIDLVTRLGDRIGLPASAAGGPAVAYLEALVAWYQAIQDTDAIARLWDRITRLVGVDFGSRVALRVRFVTLLSEIGLGIAVPPEVEAAVMACADQAYLFHFEDRQFLSLLAFKLDRHLRDGDQTILSGPWLFQCCRCLADSPYSRRRRKIGQRSLMALKGEIHSRIARACRLSEIVRGRFGGVRQSLVLALIKLDHALFIATGLSTWRQTYPWYVVLRWALRRLARPRLGRPRPRGAPRGGLSILEPGRFEPLPGDILVTRVQGGFGDVMMMRPGLVELARRRRGSRVIFATDPAYFAVFSPDDDLCLVDIRQRLPNPAAFDQWINFTNCPAARAEVAQLPQVRTNRIQIFANALGLTDFDLKRIPPLRFDPAIDTPAEAILQRHVASGTRTVGIQLRSAETYRDVPALRDVAQALGAKHRVFLFDSHPIPRRADDRFVAIDDQPLAVVLALASKLDLLVTPDSSLLHLAGTNRVRCLGVFGPTDGAVRCAQYPTVEAFDLRAEFACIPCWRNQDVKCRVTDGPQSACMHRVSVGDIVERVEMILREAT